MKNILNKSIFLILSLLLLVMFNCQSIGNSEDAYQEAIDRLFLEYDNQFLEFLATAVQETGKETIKVSQLSDRYSVPKTIDIMGTPYDIGYTIGRIAHQYNRPPRLIVEASRDLNRHIVEMYRRIYPQYLEIIRGVADACAVDFELVDFSRMEYDFFVGLWTNLLQYDRFSTYTDFGKYGDVVPTDNCSIASYYTGERHLVGRNFDNPSDRPHYFASTHMEGSYKMMGNVIYALYHWVVDGINEKGLSINCATNGEEYFWTESYPQEPAVFSGHMARIVMDTCATVDEAVELIGSVRVWFPNEGLHWIIADASGKSVVVEFDHSRNMVLLDKEGPYELMTNTALQKGDDYVANNCWRYRTAKPMLESGILDMNDMFTIMETIRPTSGSSRTLWTSVMDVTNKRFEVYYRKEYSKKYEFGF
jgi:hypothetical protein